MSERTKSWFMRFLVALGALSLAIYFGWWFFEGRIGPPWIGLILVLGIVCALPQLVGNWFLYLNVQPQNSLPEGPGRFSVDVFVTACKEPLEMIERALAAACAMHGKHQTWLLDDGADPQLARLARQFGAGYQTRQDRKNAKAGNINAALAKTSGEIIVIFDIDHVPEPDFLDRTVNYFHDPAIGFVQVMLTFGNSAQSWVAGAAAETSLDYYNPTSRGADGLGGATLTGSNALIRRSALDSIGGYQPGLAEDLATSIALHAAGWRSVYVNEPLAPGLAPHDLTAWFTQQLKWARGVFELLVTSYFRYFPRLTWGQRVSYAVRMTYYWIGPVVAVHIFLTAGVLFSGSSAFYNVFHDYLIRLYMLGQAAILIRQVALFNWHHPSMKRVLLWKPISLIYTTWPIYSLAWLMTMLRIPLAFRPTPKNTDGRLNPVWLLPQAISVLVLGGGALYPFLVGKGSPILPALFAGFQVALQIPVFFQWFQPKKPTRIFFPTIQTSLPEGNAWTDEIRKSVNL